MPRVQVAMHIHTTGPRAGAAHVRSAIIILLGIIPLFVGQKNRELLPPDDLREVEVAREMYEGGDYVIPRLAGLPFVEKPPGFQAVVAAAYRLAGGPSAPAARFTAAGFALLTLAAVFLLARRILGVEGGALALAFLAFSQRFLRTSHLILLDNALTCAVAFTMLFAWLALDARTPGKKRLAYAAAGLSLGVSFLFKGFVGPVIFGSGFVCYLLLSGRLRELGHVLRPLPVMAFLVPVLAWVIPFVRHADSALVREFFIANHVGRFVEGYISPQRPFYFYVKNLLLEFSPGAILLPSAALMAWKARRDPQNQAGLFLLSLFLGPLVVLSLSVAKDFVYFLPVHPALAVLAAWCAVPAWNEGRRETVVFTWIMVCLVALSAGVMVVATVILGVEPLETAGLAVLYLAGSACCVLAARRGSAPWAGVWAATLLAFGWCLWFTGPVARADIARRGYGDTVKDAITLAGSRDIVLYRPPDGLRGAAGFYRNRTARELTDPDLLVKRLDQDRGGTVLLLSCDKRARHLEDLVQAARRAGLEMHIEASVDTGGEGRRFLLVTARRPVRGNGVKGSPGGGSSPPR